MKQGNAEKQVSSLIGQLRDAAMQSRDLSKDIENRLETVLPLTPPETNEKNPSVDGQVPLARDMQQILDDIQASNNIKTYILKAIQL